MNDDTQLTVLRTFDAPRERVYRAFTDPDELAQWFVPEGMEAGDPRARPGARGRDVRELDGR